MKTYTTLRTNYGTYTNNSSSTNLSDGDTYINDAIRRIIGNRDWPFLEAQDTAQTTSASVQYYALPSDAKKITDVTVTIGNVLYHPREVTNRDNWDRMNYALNVTSNIPQWYFIYNGQVGFWPKPSTGGNVITFNYTRRVIDLTFTDVTSTTIITATRGSTAFVVSGGMTQALQGMWIQPTFSSSPNKGDGAWYQISSSTIAATTFTISAPYNGQTITAGTAACLIGQVPVLPEGYQIMPVYYAAMEYWRVAGNNIEKANEFKGLYNDMLEQLQRDWGSKSNNPQIDKGIGEVPIINPNLTITI